MTIASITKWPAAVREHRTWSDEPYELTGWYIADRRIPLIWLPPGVWDFGISWNAGTICVSFGKAVLYVDKEQIP